MPPKSGAPDEVDLDKLLQTLSDPVRRDIICYFENQPTDTASLEDLITHIGSRNASKTGDELRTVLYQVHLPTLESGGWLEFDTEQETVSYHGQQDAEQSLRELYAVFEE